MTPSLSLALDLVRIGAALMVLVGHAVQLGVYRGAYPFTMMAQHNAVVVFFVLSGLVIKTSTDNNPQGLGGYVAARIARLAPMAAVATMIGTACAIMAGREQIPLEIFGTSARMTPLAVVSPLVFLSERLQAGPVWNPPFWSLCFEACYYALFGAATFLRGWRRSLALVAIVLFFGGRPLLLLPIWLLGVALARLRWRRSITPVQGALYLVAGLAVLSISNSLAAIGFRFMWEHVSAYLPLGYAAFAPTDVLLGVGVALAFTGLRPLTLPFAELPLAWEASIRRAAEVTFPVYLLHWPLLSLLASHGMVAGDSTSRFLAILTAVVLVCVVITVLIAPASKRLRGLLAELLQPQPDRVTLTATPQLQAARALLRQSA